MIYEGDCLDIMPTLADKSVDLTVTSPPYDNLRTYNNSLVWNFEIFQKVAKELFRVTKDGGVVVWVVGDATINGSETGTSFRQALYFKEIGFNLHDTMIYKKHNFANPSLNRYHQIFEYMFVFSKGKPATFNAIKDKINSCAGQTNWGKNTHRQKDGTLKEHHKKICNLYGMRLNIWEFRTGYGFAGDKLMYQHPATFPEQLATDHILSWSNPGDTVLDPFAGSGTTGIACIKTGRNYILIEKVPEYCEIIRERIKNNPTKEKEKKIIEKYKHIRYFDFD